jgi:OFA family oxalate/formate antiporter-like MFS transporter
VATLVRWFPDKRGLISGIAVAGFGGGALLTALLAPVLIRSFGVMHTFMLLGVLYLVCIVGSASLLRMPSASYAPAGWQGPESRPVGCAAPEYTIAAALRTWQWYLLWLILFLNIVPGAGIIAMAAAMAQDVSRAGAGAAAALVMSNAIGNVAGRVLWAATADRLGCKVVFCGMLLFQAVALLVMPGATSFWFLSGCAFAVMLSNGGGFSTMPAFVTQCFGARHVGQVYGLMLTAWGTAAIAGPLLMAQVFDSTGHYAPALQLFAVATLAGALLPIVVRLPAERGAAGLARLAVPAVGS